jgi:hypothetical protein
MGISGSLSTNQSTESVNANFNPFPGGNNQFGIEKIEEIEEPRNAFQSTKA